MIFFFQHEMKKNFQKTLAASHVAQQTDIKICTHNTLFMFSKTCIGKWNEFVTTSSEM